MDKIQDDPNDAKKDINNANPKEIHECIVCGISFAYKEVYNRHISTYHKGKPRKCLKCGKMVFDLKLHNRNKHPKESEFDKNITKVQDEIKESTNENHTQLLDNPELPLLKKVQEHSQEIKLDEKSTKIQMIKADVQSKVETDIKPKLKPSDKNYEINTGLEVISSIKGPDAHKVCQVSQKVCQVSQKFAKKVYIPTGKPRGQPAGARVAKVYVPTGKSRGRPANSPVTVEIQDDPNDAMEDINEQEMKIQDEPNDVKEDITVTIEIQDDNDKTKKVLDNPNDVLLLGKTLKHFKRN